MDGSKTQEDSSYCIDEILGFDSTSNLERSRNFLTNLVKSCLLRGADKVLMTRKPSPTLFHFDSEPHKVSAKCSSVQNDNTFCLEPKNSGISNCKFDSYIDVTNVVNSPLNGYNEFPLNIITFFLVILLKLGGFQTNLLVALFLLPIRLSYFSIMLIFFPFQTLIRIPDHLMKKIMRMWVGLYLNVTAFICNKFKTQKYVVDLAVRVGWALFWSAYVWFLLVGLLVSGFIIGGLTMRRLVEEPIQRTETLNFDYTRASPVAFVPIMPSNGVGHFNGLVPKENVEDVYEVYKRVIPYNHKVKLHLFLTLPESDYNRNLGVFQVMVEFLSSNGKVTASLSYPCMLKFKSQSIRLAETMLKSIPVVAGFQSEVKVLNVKISGFTEGFEPTAWLRVSLEQRAEYKGGAGIPEVYSAFLALESELPRFKRIVWLWRRTIFVWISIMSFVMELVVVLVFCRPIIFPRGRTLVVFGGSKKNAKQNNISW